RYILSSSHFYFLSHSRRPSTSTLFPYTTLFRSYRVLVVDDEPLIARAIKRALAPFVVHIANDGEEALAALAGNTFDAILCDLMMPRVSGADLYAHIEENYPHLLGRIVFMTGGAFSEWSQRFLESVSCPVMEKPFQPLQLRECIESVAKKSRRNR